MRFVSPDDGQVYPQASPSGDQGVMLDTGWDVHYPGPARIYLSEVDIRDILTHDEVLSRPLVFDLLEARGWTSPAKLAEMVADFEAQLEKAVGERDSARAEADGLVLALQRCAPAEAADEVLVGSEV